MYNRIRDKVSISQQRSKKPAPLTINGKQSQYSIDYKQTNKTFSGTLYIDIKHEHGEYRSLATRRLSQVQVARLENKAR